MVMPTKGRQGPQETGLSSRFALPFLALELR